MHFAVLPFVSVPAAALSLVLAVSPHAAMDNVIALTSNTDTTFFQFIYNPPCFTKQNPNPLVRRGFCLLIVLQKSEFAFCCYTTLCCLLIIEL